MNRHLAKNNGFQANLNKDRNGDTLVRYIYIWAKYGYYKIIKRPITPYYACAELPIHLTVEKGSKVSREGEDGDGLPHGVEPLKPES